MPNSFFKFKKFTIYHDQCAMKVGTDGCLLGGWAKVDQPKRILDIGTGTGLVAIMLAQRFSHAQIDAVEVEETCAKQAKENVAKCPWKERVKAHNCSIQEFRSSSTYDLIVSNPPFFSKSYQSPKENRHTARHDDLLTPDDLFKYGTTMLNPTGHFCIVIPVERFADFNNSALLHGLFINKQVNIKPTPIKAVKRVLLDFSFQKHPILESEMYIEKSRGQYSEDFTKLLHNFYLYL